MTAYCQGTRGADGTPVYRGMAAAGYAYPFRTRFIIPGVGLVTVHDRGGAIGNGNIDVYMSCGSAVQWGRRWLPVRVLR